LDLAEWERMRMRRRLWQDVLRRMQADAEVRVVRARTHTGRPLAGDAFMAKLERLVGRRLRPLPVGRPRKPKAKKQMTVAYFYSPDIKWLAGFGADKTEGDDEG